jgi:ethanolamine utilization protein EutA
LTEELARPVRPAAVTFSGGVSEYIFGYESHDYGDIARLLATALGEELQRRGAPLAIDPGQRIRATVIGASQFTVQVSGKTIFLPDPGVLPLHNVPVVHAGLDLADTFDPIALTAAIRSSLARMDLSPDARMAIAFAWHGDPDYARIAAAGRAIVAAVAPDGTRKTPLLLMIDGDVGKTFGQLLRNELGLAGPLVSIDGVQLQELDFVDVGELLSPPGVVPVVIKSLLFS